MSKRYEALLDVQAKLNEIIYLDSGAADFLNPEEFQFVEQLQERVLSELKEAHRIRTNE